MGKRRAVQKLIAGMTAALVSAQAAAAACSDDRLELRGPWGQAQFSVEVADSPDERARGLMFREHLPRSAGMLFRYESPQSASFWMKNTLIPLDMLFADDKGQVRHIAANAVPQDLTPILGGPDILLVLEINGGLARRLGITEGTQLRTPLLDQTQALWPCSP